MFTNTLELLGMTYDILAVQLHGLQELIRGAHAHGALDGLQLEMTNNNLVNEFMRTSIIAYHFYSSQGPLQAYKVNQLFKEWSATKDFFSNLFFIQQQTRHAAGRV